MRGGGGRLSHQQPIAMAMGHVILREFFLDRQVPYFQDYCRRYTDMPAAGAAAPPGRRYVRQSDLPGTLGT